MFPCTHIPKIGFDMFPHTDKSRKRVCEETE